MAKKALVTLLALLWHGLIAFHNSWEVHQGGTEGFLSTEVTRTLLGVWRVKLLQ